MNTPLLLPAHAATPHEIAVRAEAADAANWLDNFAAAPDAVAAGLALRWQRVGDLSMVASRVPFSHFSMVLTLGCPAPADDAAFAAIDAFYGDAMHWVMVNDHSRPADLAQRLIERGYRDAGAWERVLMRGVPPARSARWAALAEGCELVGHHNAGEWADFLLRCYGMPAPIANWLQALVGRPNWIHALLRAGGRADGPVVMVRSLFLHEGWAWLGIDAPVPGVMAPCFEDDQRVTAALLWQALGAGAHSFVSDIEVPAANRSGPAYERWGELGFAPAYRRRLMRKG